LAAFLDRHFTPLFKKKLGRNFFKNEQDAAPLPLSLVMVRVQVQIEQYFSSFFPLLVLI